MKTWDDFLPLLRPHVPSCPDITIKSYLGIVAADFFTRTHLWRDNIDSIYVAPGIYEYDLSADALVEHVISVIVDDREVERTDMRLIPNERRYSTGHPTHYWIQSDNAIRLFPIPDKKVTLKLTAVLRPSRTGTGVEDWIYEMWADAIVAGTVAQLTSIPGKDWSSADVYGYNAQKYERAITNARIRDQRGVSNSVQMRPFA